jgi:hypothetical protein
MEAVGGDARRVDEAVSSGPGRSAEGVERPVDVDRPRRVAVRRPGDEEGEVDDDIGVGERLLQGRFVADVPLAVLHLRPAAGGRIKRTPGDADDPLDAIIGLEQGYEAGAEGPGRAGHGDGELARALLLRGGHGSEPPRSLGSRHVDRPLGP